MGTITSCGVALLRAKHFIAPGLLLLPSKEGKKEESITLKN